MRPRPLWISLALIGATVIAGLAIRFGRLGLPQVVAKYGGSALWALMIYWIVSTLLLRRRIPVCVLFAGLIATAVEFLKLYHTPALDSFRLTLPGILLLGRLFSPWDIVAYWVAVWAGALLDSRLRPYGTP
jgi:hypothetical protein